eukprot:148708_1
MGSFFSGMSSSFDSCCSSCNIESAEKNHKKRNTEKPTKLIKSKTYTILPHNANDMTPTPPPVPPLPSSYSTHSMYTNNNSNSNNYRSYNFTQSQYSHNFQYSQQIQASQQIAMPPKPNLSYAHSAPYPMPKIQMP